MAPKAKKMKRPRTRKPRVGEKVSAPKPIEINITAAKGRPMLHWVGKRPLSRVRFFPAQHIETFAPSPAGGGGKSSRAPESDIWREWPAMYPKGGLLFHGDNKEVLGHLLASGFRNKVNLVYIDPPFDSGADYVRRVSLRGPKGTAKIEGEAYTLGEQIQYTDIWANDNYLQFMYERLMLIKELLADNGCIYLHCDYRKMHMLRLLLDEVFGPDNHLNSLVWMFSTRSAIKSSWKRTHHDILLYKKYLDPIFNWDDDMVREPLSEATIEKYKLVDDEGEKYRLCGRNIKGSPIRSAKDVDPSYEKTHPEWVVRDYLRSGKSASDYFFIDIENQASKTRTDYPTQKPEELLFKLISASTKPGSLVLDCFSGSGTTIASAQKLGRRWIGCDINKGAIQTTSKRLQNVIKDQLESRSDSLPGIEDENRLPAPSQSSFSVWRVNDYDLAIQHNEAVNLACEKIGIERKRTDAFFEGTLGKSLVKIVPFGHPLTPLDLEEIRRELEARPDEDRPLTVVTLGTELAAMAWIEEWNRLRKGRDGVNRITVVDLRTDPTHGGFIRHESARARVKIARKNGEVHVAIEDFISPTIIERLREQAGILKPKIDDWRSMVDCVMIDPGYDGKVFKIALSDVPERKADLVVGKYELPAPAGETTIAVKIIDMLGEEIIVTAKV